MQPNNLDTKQPEHTSIALSLITIGIAILVLIGWQFDFEILKRPMAHQAAMNPVSAIALLLAGWSMLLLTIGTRSSSLISRFISPFIVLIGLLRLLEISIGLKTGIDLTLFSDKIITDAIGNLSNRMAANTALCFVMVGTALFLSSYNDIKYKRLANTFSIPALIIGLLSLLGYVYQVKEFYNTLAIFPIPIHSALCVVLLCWAVIHNNSNVAFFLKTFNSPFLGGVLARQLIPAIILIPVLLGLGRLIVLWQYPTSEELGVAVLVISIIIALFGIIWYLSALLNASDEARTIAEQGLKKFTERQQLLLASRTEKLIHTESQFLHTLENMREGVQIINYNWQYEYVNPALATQGRYKQEDYLGHTMMQKYPGIEQSEMFSVLQDCMLNRNSHSIENEFSYPDGSVAYFELNIKPVPEGIFIISSDITEQRLAREKLIKANRLYAVISNINQSIVHIREEQELLDKACVIVVQMGLMQIAWIGMWEEDTGKLTIRSIEGPEQAKKAKKKFWQTEHESPLDPMIEQMLHTGRYVLNSDLLKEERKGLWIETLLQNNIRSRIVFPLKKFGRTIGVFSFDSTEPNFFDDQEIALLAEAAGDISFALEVMDKDSMRRKAQEEMLHNQLLLKEAQSIAHIGHWEYDLATRMTTWSEETCRIYGIDIDDNHQTFEQWMSFVHPQDEDEIIKIMRDSLVSFNDVSMEHRIITADIQVRHIHTKGTYKFDTNGNPLGLHGITHDITEQKQAQENIRKSEANLNAVVENSDAMIYSLDTNLRYQTFNKLLKDTVLDVYGLELKPGQSVYQFLERMSQGELENWKQIYTEALNGTSLQFVKEFKFGEVHSFSQFSINPIRVAGKVTGLSCFVRDITRQKLAELEIITLNESLEKKVKERTAELQDAVKELEAFSYTVSHDLQSPLRLMKGFSRLLLKDYEIKLDDDGKKLLEIIDNSANQMQNLITDLLHFSKLGKTPLIKKKVNMMETVSIVLEEIKNDTKNFHTEIKLDYLNNAICDPALLRQVWLNLIGNAVKYSSKKEHPIVEIGMNDDSHETIYYVKDNGAGFDMKHAEKLFGVFQRVHSSSEFEGTGVGLATVQRIITKHGGRIWTESRVNEGASFYFTLGDSHIYKTV